MSPAELTLPESAAISPAELTLTRSAAMSPAELTLTMSPVANRECCYVSC